jgi:hypothetical protein
MKLTCNRQTMTSNLWWTRHRFTHLRAVLRTASLLTLCYNGQGLLYFIQRWNTTLQTADRTFAIALSSQKIASNEDKEEKTFMPWTGLTLEAHVLKILHNLHKNLFIFCQFTITKLTVKIQKYEIYLQGYPCQYVISLLLCSRFRCITVGVLDATELSDFPYFIKMLCLV